MARVVLVTQKLFLARDSNRVAHWQPSCNDCDLRHSKLAIKTGTCHGGQLARLALRLVARKSKPKN
jgi:hypothetical protein